MKKFRGETAPDGYEFTGEYRVPKYGEYYITPLCRRVAKHEQDWLVWNYREIVRKVKEPKEVTITLPEPKEGYEWGEPCKVKRINVDEGFDGLAIYQVPKKKYYDWSKTSRNTLIVSGNGVIKCFKDCIQENSSYLAEGVWQAHIGGNPCPVDPEATMVEIRLPMGSTWGPCVANNINWSVDQLYLVVGLVDGYEYKREDK